VASPLQGVVVQENPRAEESTSGHSFGALKLYMFQSVLTMLSPKRFLKLFLLYGRLEDGMAPRCVTNKGTRLIFAGAETFDSESLGG
jgi:hypothetical protein